MKQKDKFRYAEKCLYEYKRNMASIKGISLHSGEDEILVSDYGTKISKIDNQVIQGDGYYHIYVQ